MLAVVFECGIFLKNYVVFRKAYIKKTQAKH